VSLVVRALALIATELQTLKGLLQTSRKVGKIKFTGYVVDIRFALFAHPTLVESEWQNVIKRNKS
jgi:hypothetical protein